MGWPSGSAAKRFGDIEFLTHLGRTPADAAAIAANAADASSGPGALHGMPAKVRAAVAGMHSTSWTHWLANRWGDVQDIGPSVAEIGRVYSPLNSVRGFWKLAQGESGEAVLDAFFVKSRPLPPGHATHNMQANTYQVHKLVERYATLLAHSGQFGTPDEAIEQAVAYISNPKVSARVNGTLYLRSELPQAPGAESQEEWLEKFIDQVPKAAAHKQGFSGAEVRMEYNQATRGFTAMVGNLPMLAEDGQSVVTYSKADIQRWYANTWQAEVAKAAAASKYTVYRARLENEIGKLPGNAMYQYDPHLNGAFFKARISSPEAFERITRDGNAGKPLAELMRLYPRSKPKPFTD